MKNLLFFIPILIILTFSSCTEKKDTAYVPEELKAYTIFNEGTWWVYKDIVSNALDSCFVFSSNKGIENHDRSSYKKEIINQLTVRRQDTIYQETLAIEKLSDDIYTYIYREENFSKFTPIMSLLPYPVDSINQQVPIQGGAIITAIEEETFIQNQNYHNTISVSFDGAIAENGNPLWRIRSCTFAQNVGMIRIQYYDGTIWELVDYHIAD